MKTKHNHLQATTVKSSVDYYKIFDLLCKGYTHKEISAELYIDQSLVYYARKHYMADWLKETGRTYIPNKVGIKPTINYQKMQELIDSGLKEKEIAKLCKCSISSVSKFKKRTGRNKSEV